MKLIDKDVVVTKIEERIKEIDELGTYLSPKGVLTNLLCHLNTLKVKEVNLDKELESWRHNHFHGRRDKEASGEYLKRVSQLDLAKHFFELGLKVAQKGEEV